MASPSSCVGDGLRRIPLSRAKHNTSGNNLIHPLRTPAYELPIRGGEIGAAAQWCMGSSARSRVRRIAIDVEAVLPTIITTRSDDSCEPFHRSFVCLVCIRLAPLPHRLKIPHQAYTRFGSQHACQIS